MLAAAAQSAAWNHAEEQEDTQFISAPLAPYCLAGVIINPWAQGHDPWSGGGVMDECEHLIIVSETPPFFVGWVRADGEPLGPICCGVGPG